MLSIVLLAFTFVIAWKLAAFEDRTPWPWAIGALLAEFGLMHVAAFGPWYILYPVAPLGCVFAGLWWMRARDERNDRNRPGPRVIR